MEIAKAILSLDFCSHRSHGEFLCGISSHGNVFAISADIARLEGWAQNLWHRENILPEDLAEYQKHELFRNQMLGAFLHMEASPEQIFSRLVNELGEVFKRRTDLELWQDIDTGEEAIENVSRFVSKDDSGLVMLAKYILVALSERMSSPNLRTYIANDEVTKDLKSIELFEKALFKLNETLDVKNLCDFCVTLTYFAR